MLFGRLRVPYERLAAEPRESARSGLRAAFAPTGPRGDSPRRSLSLLPAGLDEEYAGLDHLDREELDETD
jgi:hypothetical protein